MKEMKIFEFNLLDNKMMYGVYYNEYCLCRKLFNKLGLKVFIFFILYCFYFILVKWNIIF